MAVNLSTEALLNLEETANRYGLDAGDLLNEALKTYRRRREEIKIEAEKQEFLRQYVQLKATYPGQFIAMHYGEVVDCDPDFEILHHRVRQKYGREAVLIRQVGEKPEQPIMMRSPKVHWSSPWSSPA